ncbi:hypothetical protein [uncultured Parasutterella sp.]|uniref:hypothetical protein n=1 Tax=uncultured Parasutterella sp. TaxID=1263098 RepID=UPI00258C75B3|nr:hypothetical protein [uncultured Parasutterella sp.]
MRTTTTENIKIIINVFIKKLCEEQAEKRLSMSETEAAEFGVFDETALEEKQKDKFYESFVLKSFAKVPSGGEYEESQ